MPFSLAQRLLHTLAPRPVRLSAAVRTEVRPPTARQRPMPWRRRLAAWLGSGPVDGSVSTSFDELRPSNQNGSELVDARTAFRSALADIPPPQADACFEHIRAARSLHELWHVRSELFNLVSRHHSQCEADRRLGLVDRHFPSRSRRTGPSRAIAKDGHESLPPI